MYELTVSMEFQAAHQLRDYEGKCARLHGHNYRLEVAVASEELNEQGLVMDFNDLKARMRRVLEAFDHQHLNEVEPFSSESGQNPTCENLARVLYERLAEQMSDPSVRVSRVRLWETASSAVTYSECG
ncbi:MAG: 6-carboxytetrahydropterin synthase QueD [Armatimonadota bacterium]